MENLPSPGGQKKESDSLFDLLGDGLPSAQPPAQPPVDSSASSGGLMDLLGDLDMSAGSGAPQVTMPQQRRVFKYIFGHVKAYHK